jgi:hypothetical protein
LASSVFDFCPPSLYPSINLSFLGAHLKAKEIFAGRITHVEIFNLPLTYSQKISNPFIKVKITRNITNA